MFEINFFSLKFWFWLLFIGFIMKFVLFPSIYLWKIKKENG
jgi:uncharacterized membrane protein